MKTLLRTALGTAVGLVAVFGLAACLDSSNPIAAPENPIRSTGTDSVPRAPSSASDTVGLCSVGTLGSGNLHCRT